MHRLCLRGVHVRSLAVFIVVSFIYIQSSPEQLGFSEAGFIQVRKPIER